MSLLGKFDPLAWLKGLGQKPEGTPSAPAVLGTEVERTKFTGAEEPVHRTAFGSDGRGQTKDYSDEQSAEILAPLQKHLRHCLAQREIWEERWLRNLMTFNGNPHYDSERFSRVEARAQDRVEENPISVRSNHVGRIVRGISSRMLSRKTMVRAVPASAEQEDSQAAEAATSGLKFMARENQELALNRRLAKLILTCGTAFKWARWDPDAEAKKVSDTAGGGGQGKALRQAAEAGEIGQVVVEVLNAYQVIGDIEVARLDDQSRFFIMTRQSEEWLAKNYPEKAEAGSRHGSDWQRSLEARYRTLMGVQEGDAADLGHELIVFLAFERQSGRGLEAKYKVTMWTGNCLLGTMFVDHNGLTKYDCYENEGLFYSRSLVDDLYTLQVEYNRFLSDEQYHARLHAHPMLLKPRECGIADDKIVNGPGVVIDYVASSGHKPDYMMPPPFNKDVKALKEALVIEMETISGFQQIWSGGVPAGVKSGRAIEALNEQIYANWQETFESFDDSEARHNSVKLLLMRTNWQEDRLIEYVGRDKVMEVQSLSGAKMRNTRDVVIEMAAGQGSQEAKENFVMELLKQGLLTPERREELKLAQEMMGLTPMDETMDRLVVGRKMGEEVVRRLNKGEPVGLEKWHFHEEIKKVMLEYMNMPSFNGQPTELQERFARTLAEVNEFIADRMMLEQAAMAGVQAQMNGGGMGPGQGQAGGGQPGMGMEKIPGGAVA